MDPTTQDLQIQNRSQIPLLLNKLGLNGQGVEVGVYMAGYSFELLKNSKLQTLYSVDPWIKFSEEDHYDGMNISNDYQNFRYLITIMRLLEFSTRAVILRMTSESSAQLFKDNSLDFVYIDANHSYEACKQDVDLWWPKVKRGGILSGHDYLDAPMFGVKRAIDEFAERKKQKLYITNKIELHPSWYIIKQPQT